MVLTLDIISAVVGAIVRLCSLPPERESGALYPGCALQRGCGAFGVVNKWRATLNPLAASNPALARSKSPTVQQLQSTGRLLPLVRVWGEASHARGLCFATLFIRAPDFLCCLRP